MPKYWVKNYFAHGRFPKVGQKQKTEREQARVCNKLQLGTIYTNGSRSIHNDRL